jgi:hypothetical protein
LGRGVTTTIITLESLAAAPNSAQVVSDMSEFIYRKANLLASDTHALLGSVLVAIPKTALEELKAKPTYKSWQEDALFRELVNESDFQIINRLVLSPFGRVTTEFEVFPLAETGDLSNPTATSADGKQFWRL